MVSKSRVFYLSLLFLLLPAVFSQQDIDCNEIPQDGCLVFRDLIFEEGIFYIPNGISIANDNIILDCNNATLYGGYESDLNAPRTEAITIDSIINLTIKNCYIDGYGTNGAGIIVRNSKNIIFDNIVITRTNNAFDFDSLTDNENITIKNSFIKIPKDPAMPKNYKMEISAKGFNSFFNNIFDIDDLTVGGYVPAVYNIYNNTFTHSIYLNNILRFRFMINSNITNNYFNVGVILGNSVDDNLDPRVQNSIIYNNVFDGNPSGFLYDYGNDSFLYRWNPQGGTYNVSYCYKNNTNIFINGAIYEGNDEYFDTCSSSTPKSSQPSLKSRDTPNLGSKTKLFITSSLQIFNEFKIHLIVIIVLLVIFIVAFSFAKAIRNSKNKNLMLRKYVTKNLEKGFSRDMIRQKLIQHGWPEEMIDKIINEVKF